MKKVQQILLILSIILSTGFAGAQINGTAGQPLPSDAQNPVYYFIESASDGSFTFNSFTGDFRGNVIICPASAGKLMHKPLSAAPTVDHALWAIVNISGNNYLKNKATGMYMSGSHSAAVDYTGKTFNYVLIGNNQYRMYTTDAGSSCTNTWKDNLCDRLNTGFQLNSMTAWYFIAQPQTPLEVAILTARSAVLNSKQGIHPGQYSSESRTTLNAAIAAAESVRDNASATEEDKTTATTTLNNAITAYNNSKNVIKISTNENEYWYFIKGQRGSTALSLFAENQGAGKQVLNKERSLKDTQLWKVVANGDGYVIQNKADATYMNGDAGASPVNMGTKAEIPAVNFKITKSTYANDVTDKIDFFLIENTGASVTFRVHSGSSSNNFGLMNYTGGASDNCSFQFLTYDPSDVLSIAILNAENLYSKSPTGINPGTYTTSVKSTFRAAIDAAITINNGNSTNTEKETAAISLAQAQTDFKAACNPIVLSTPEKDVWYYISNVNTVYANGKVIVNQNNTAGTPILFTDKSLDPNKLWQFIDAGNGKMSIKNRASGFYIPANPRSEGTSTTPVPFTATFLGEDGQFTFNADGQNPLHAQQSGSVLVTWAGGLNTASAWRLEQLPEADNNIEVSISGSTIKQRYTETGIGNRNQTLMYATLNTSGLVGAVSLKSVSVDFSGTTNINAIERIKIYASGNNTKLNTSTHTLLGTIESPSSIQSVNVNFETPLAIGLGSTVIHFVADVSETASEGDKLAVRLLSVGYENNGEKSYVPTTKAAPFATTVFLKQSIVYTPGDYNSVSYRIPALITAADGSLIVLTDKRKNHSGDLPADIDVVANRSTDGGKTWSAPITVAQGTGNSNGFGDAAIIKAKSGKLIALFVNGTGFFGSTAANPMKHFMSTSTDNGLTWSTPRDITTQLYGAGCSDPVRATWLGSFFGSGRGLTTRSGRVMAVIAVREPNKSTFQNYAVYSDDEGETWKVSNTAIVGGDEAKVVELNNGDILMSSRTGGNRLWAKSTDGGVTWGSKNSWSEIWGNACDADIVRFTSTLDGFDKNRIIHTLPNASDRRNLSMWLSYDEGTTWPVKKTICPNTSAYSSITILPDSTIGVYYETDGDQAYTMMFVNFSLDWLTNGVDKLKTSTGFSQNKLSDINVYAENGYIRIKGSDAKPRVFMLNGVAVADESKLNPGIYIVEVENTIHKLTVK